MQQSVGGPDINQPTKNKIGAAGAKLNCQLRMYRYFFNANTQMAIKCFDIGVKDDVNGAGETYN